MVRRAPLVAVLLAAGCGGLGTPDLRTGVVEGRVVGHTAGKAFVYALGDPRLAAGDPAAVAPVGDDGTFRLEAPTGTAEIVVYDGSGDPASGIAAGLGRAARVTVQVRGADRVRVADQNGEGAPVPDAEKMPLAGGVLAGARAETGAWCKDPRFEVKGTDRAGTGSKDRPVAWLAPLPPGRYRLAIQMAGYRPSEVDVDVASAASTPYEVELLVDDQDGGDRGCLATGGCEPGLLCDSDGRCREDTTTAQLCGAPCDGSGSNGGCASGLGCASNVCRPPAGATCDAYLAAVGTACVTDDACRAALVNGQCGGKDDHTAGYCTASCQADADCAGFPGGGWTCSSSVCLPPL